MFAPALTEHASMTACQANAKAAVEALATIQGEKAMPALLKGGKAVAVEDERGVWVIRYDRQLRTDAERGEAAVSRMVRAVCRPVEG